MRILYSRLQDMHNFEYYAYDPKESVVEYHLNHKLKAYINNQGRVELLLPCGKIVVYVTEDGLLYTGMKTKRIDDDCREHVNFTDFKRV